jgi:hypothetical protein
MKNYLVLISLMLLITPQLFAAPWSVLDNSAETAGEGRKKRWYTKGLINEVYDGKEITYCVQGEATKAPLKNWSMYIEDAFNSWLQDTRKYIDASGRAHEFENLLTTLDGKVNLRYVDCPCGLNKKPFMKGIYFKQAYSCINQGEEPRIFFIIGQDVSSANGNSSSYGFHRRDKETDRHLVVANANSAIYDTLQHEIGHALGLGDQYDRALYNSLPQTGVRDELPSIMNHAETIQCDDAEGIINLIDCFRAPPAEQFDRGGGKGWQSICPGRDITYAKCLAKGRATGVVVSKDGESLNINEYDKSGRLKKQKEIRTVFFINPYNIYDKRSYVKEERDNRGRLKYLKDLEGKETFFEYTDKGFKYYTVEDSYFENKRIATSSVEVSAAWGKGEIQVHSKYDNKGSVQAIYSEEDGSHVVYKNYFGNDNKRFADEGMKFTGDSYSYIVRGSTDESQDCIFGQCSTAIITENEEDVISAGICRYSGKYIACARVKYKERSEEIVSFEDNITYDNLLQYYKDEGLNAGELHDNYRRDYDKEETKDLRESMTPDNLKLLLWHVLDREKEAKQILELPAAEYDNQEQKVSALQNITLNRETPKERKQSAKIHKEFRKIMKEEMKKWAPDGSSAPQRR